MQNNREIYVHTITTSTGCTKFRQARGTLGDKRVHL